MREFALGFLLGLGFTFLCVFVSGDGKPDYCYVDSYIQTESRIFKLYAHRSWRQDAVLLATPDAAEASASLIFLQQQGVCQTQAPQTQSF